MILFKIKTKKLFVKFTKFVKILNQYWPCLRPCPCRGIHRVMVYIVGPLLKILSTVYCQQCRYPRGFYLKVTVYIAGSCHCLLFRVYCHSFVLISEKRWLAKVHSSVLFSSIFIFCRFTEANYSVLFLFLFTQEIMLTICRKIVLNYSVKIFFLAYTTFCSLYLQSDCTFKPIVTKLCFFVFLNIYCMYNSAKVRVETCLIGHFFEKLKKWWDSLMRFSLKLSKGFIFRVHSFSPTSKRQLTWSVAHSGGHCEFFWWLSMVSSILHSSLKWRRHLI